MLSQRLQEIEQKLHSLAHQGNEFCTRIERSQARKPLMERFETFACDLKSAPFAVTLLGLTLEARDAALTWFVGQDRSMVEIPSQDEPGLMELTFHERGYAIETIDGDHTKFDNLATFLEAARERFSIQASNHGTSISLVHLYMEAPTELQGITLYIPANISTLNSTVLFNRMVSKTNLLILAAPLDYEPDENTRRAVEDLSASMDAIWPIVLNPQGKEPPQSNTLTPSPSWLQPNGFLRSRLILPLLWLPTSSPPGMHGYHKIGKKSSVRPALTLSYLSERLRVMIELTMERVEEELRNLRKQQKKAERILLKQRTENFGKILGETLGRLRNYINDETNKLSHELADLSRLSTGTKGECGDAVLELIEKLDEENLDKENITHATKVRISLSFVERLEYQLTKISRNQLGRDLMLIRDSREKWAGHIREELMDYAQFDPVAEAKVIDEGQLWDNVSKFLKCDISWHGEIPRTGPMEFFRAAYSPLIMGFMLLSIILPLFGGLKLQRGTEYFAALFITAFIIMLFRARKSLAKIRIEALDKELLRVREILRGIVDRILASVNQEKIRRLGVYLSDFQKDVVHRMEQCIEKLVMKKHEQAQRESLVAQNKLRQAEKNTNENMSLVKELQRLYQECRKTIDLAKRILQEPDLRNEWSNL